MNARTLAAAAAAVAALAVSGCAASAGSTATQPSTVVAVSPTSSTQSVDPPAASPTAEPVGASGGCTLLDQAAATQVLGGDAGPGTSSGNLGEDDGLTKVDGCTYEGGGSHLGYDVVVIKGVPPDSMLTMTRKKLEAQAGSGGAKEFNTGLDKSVGFTFHVGSGIDSQIAVIAGDNWVTVAVSRKDGDGARTQASVIAAAQALVSSL